MTGGPTAFVLAGISFVLTVIWGGPLIRILRSLKIGDSIRLEAPERHAIKVGTPTMGGIMVILPALLVTILMNAVPLIGLSGIGRSILVPMGAMIVFGILGGVDDFRKLAQRQTGEGMRARTKFILQILLAAILAYALNDVLRVPDLYLPGFRTEFNVGLWFLPIAIFIIVGSANAGLYLYTPEIYPTRMRAIGTGSATCWLRLASAAGPLLVGYLLAERGTAAVFMMFAAAGVIGALAATQMLETRNRRLEDIAP